MTAVSFLLAAVMTFYAVDRLLNGAGNAIRYNAFADTLTASYEQAAAVTDEDEEASDPEETFVYSTVALDLNTHGYDTFEAVLTKSDGEKVRGLGYTDWTYISQTDGVEHYNPLQLLNEIYTVKNAKIKDDSYWLSSFILANRLESERNGDTAAEIIKSSSNLVLPKTTYFNTKCIPLKKPAYPQKIGAYP